ALLLGQFPHHRRQRELFDRADAMGNRASYQRCQPALLEGVDPEARHVGDFEGEVDLVLLSELLELGLVAEQRPQRVFGLLARERSSARVEREIAVDPVQRRGPTFRWESKPLFVDELIRGSLTIEQPHLFDSPARGLKRRPAGWTPAY